MKAENFEERLYRHAECLKSSMAAPFSDETEVFYMKSSGKFIKYRKLISMVAVAAVFLIGSTAFAMGILPTGWFSSQSGEYWQGEAAQFEQEAGFEPVNIQSFSNGYKYTDGRVMDNQIHHEDGTATEFKSTHFVYEKDGDTLYFSQDPALFPVGQYGNLLETYGGIELWYYSYINKVVPEDYEPDEADKAAEVAGDMIISYGAEEISQFTVSSLSWTENGVNYNLTQTGGKLSAMELSEMAKEILNAR